MLCGSNMDRDVWGPLEHSGEIAVSWRVGRCRLWARPAGDEWEIAVRHSDTDQESPETVAESELDWTRFVTKADARLKIVPALPDRPVVVRPATPIVILPGRGGRFFFRVPLWVRFVSAPGGRETTMAEIPTRRLASIWFGDLATGELCYAIEAHLQRNLEQLVIDRSFAACEVIVRNESRERLRFERICVHVEHMRLFEVGDRLWTNEVRVAFRGAEQISQLTFVPHPPASAADSVAISGPRVAPETNLIKRSFAFIRQITGI